MFIILCSLNNDMYNNLLNIISLYKNNNYFKINEITLFFINELVCELLPNMKLCMLRSSKVIIVTSIILNCSQFITVVKNAC